MDSKKIVFRLTLKIDSPLAFMVALKEEKAIGKEPTDEMKRGKVQIAKYGSGGLFGCRAYELRENIYLNTQNASGVFASGPLSTF